MITLNIPEEHVEILRMVFMGGKANAVESRTALYPLIVQIDKQLNKDAKDAEKS